MTSVGSGAVHAGFVAGAVVLLAGSLWVGLERVALTARVLARLDAPTDRAAAPDSATSKASMAAQPLASTATLRILGAAAGGALLAAAATDPMALVPPCIVVAGAVAIVPGLRRRRAGRGGPERLIEIVDALALRLGGGASVGTALIGTIRDHGLPPGDPLALLADDLAAGEPLQATLDRWAEAAAEPEARLVADAVAVSGASGGGSARALLQVGETLRDKVALDREIAALASQAKLSSQLLTVVPLGFAALVFVLDSRVASFALGTPVGWACLSGGALLDLAGSAWMRRLVGSVR